MRAAWASLLVVTACSFRPSSASAPDAPDAPDANEATNWLAGYHYRKLVTITSGTHAPLSSFPVGIVETGDMQLAHASPTGSDLVVTEADGTTRLARELVAFDPGAGTLELWVSVPTLAPGTQHLYLYYGGPADTTQATAVWSGFAAVWHMSGFSDSTGNGHLLSATGGPAPAQTGGIAGLARNFVGVQLAATPSGLDFSSGSFTVSLWLDLGANPSDYVEPLFHGGTSPSHAGYSLLAGPQWVMKVIDTNRNEQDTTFGDGTTLVGDWHQLVGVVDRGPAQTITAYADGAMKDPEDISNLGSLLGSDEPALGHTDAAQFFGALDEVRIYNGVLPADWIAVAYANLHDRSFAVVGDETTR